jgi:hypothetical protein
MELFLRDGGALLEMVEHFLRDGALLERCSARL